MTHLPILPVDAAFDTLPGRRERSGPGLAEAA
jgi:hypothetical protein